MKDRKDLLSKEKFWSIMDQAMIVGKDYEAKVDLLLELCDQLTDEELIGFDYQITYHLIDSYQSDLWAAAVIVLDGCEDQDFDDFRCWLITQGSEAYKLCLAEADHLIDYLSFDEFPMFPDLYSIAYTILVERHDEAFMSSIDQSYFDDLDVDVEMLMSWDDEDWSSIQYVCPKVYAKFVNNPITFKD